MDIFILFLGSTNTRTIITLSLKRNQRTRKIRLLNVEHELQFNSALGLPDLLTPHHFLIEFYYI